MSTYTSINPRCTIGECLMYCVSPCLDEGESVFHFGALRKQFSTTHSSQILSSDSSFMNHKNTTSPFVQLNLRLYETRGSPLHLTCKSWWLVSRELKLLRKYECIVNRSNHWSFSTVAKMSKVWTSHLLLACSVVLFVACKSNKNIPMMFKDEGTRNKNREGVVWLVCKVWTSHQLASM